MPVPADAHASRAHAQAAQDRLPVRALYAARAIGKRFWQAAAAAVLVSMVGGCATAPIDRYLLRAEADVNDVRFKNAHGVLSRARSKAIFDKLNRQSPDSGVLERHMAVEQALTDNPLSVGNQVALLEDGPKTYAAMLAAIGAAKQSVHLETYIFDADEIGTQFAAALSGRALAGVKVRLIYDSAGSFKTPKAFFKAMSDSGVEVVEFNPISPEAVVKGGFAALNHRDHRKLTVVDGRIAFLGGINISSVYGSVSGSLHRKNDDDEPFEKRPWRDTQVRIEGPVVADLQHAFLNQWARQKKEAPIDDKAYFPSIPAQGSLVVHAIEGSPKADGLNEMYVAFVSAVENSEKEVLIMNPYFVPHESLRRSLADAARRGVDVKILLPSHSDSSLAYHAGHSFFGDLLEAGVKIYERKDRMLHAKTAVIDGVWSTVGSTNLDWRSLLYNDEINAVVLGPEFAGRMAAVFRGDLADSEEITLEKWRNRPIEDRLKELVARIWARFL